MEDWCNDDRRRQTDILGENPVPLPLSTLQIPHLLAWDQTSDSVLQDR